MPEEQNPHCAALRAMNSLCSCESLPLSVRPSMVSTDLPEICAASVRQPRAVRPSIMTVHAPQMPCSQPRWVPVRLHVLAQEVREVLARLHAPFQRLAVQGRFDRDVFLPEGVGHGVTFSDNELSTRRVSTVAMWSLVSARSPVVSSGVRSCRIACSKADVSGSGVASPVTAAETARATLAWSTHP